MTRKVTNATCFIRGRIRASMSIKNLFNLYKKQRIRFDSLTLYQQKWMCKSETRSYHGDHIQEKRFKSIFDGNLKTFTQLNSKNSNKSVIIPYSLQTYGVLEKRLDFVLFRAMFASSIREARTLIYKRHVKVNGVVIVHPTFNLKSGDIFSVSPEQVLTALGRMKPKLKRSIEIDEKQIQLWNEHIDEMKKKTKVNTDDNWVKPKSLIVLSETKDLNKNFLNDKKKMAEILKSQHEISISEILEDILTIIKLKGENEITSSDFVAKFQEDSETCHNVYSILKELDSSLLKTFTKKDINIFFETTDIQSEQKKKLDDIILLLTKIKNTITTNNNKLLENLIQKKKFDPNYFKNLNHHQSLNSDQILNDEFSAKINLPWQDHLFGRKDPSKPYFTPWAPRPFLGCFAIYPFYLEISFLTCHGVFLRDPITRNRHSEVITPFPESVHDRAFMYYNRKGL